MKRPYRKHSGPRVPLTSGDLQLNRCRNVLCSNFGGLPDPLAGRRGAQGSSDSYKVSGSPGSQILECLACKTSVTLISNEAVAEERDRLLSLSVIKLTESCRTDGCSNVGKHVVNHSDGYQRFGKTSIGSPRYRCRACGRTFSTAVSSTHRLRRPEKTAEVFRYLINKVAMRRMCEIADIGAETLYQRIGLIYERCRAFAAIHETPLYAGAFGKDRMHLVVDRQDHLINSGSSLDSRPSVLLAVATAEAHSGYVLAQHVNFDPDADTFALDLAAREVGDPDKNPPFRRYARLWLPHERLEEDPVADGESELTTQSEFRPASRGAHVHDGVALNAHFQILERFTRSVDSVQFSMDREAGIERACLLTFVERIQEGSVDAFLVRINKDMTQSQKRRALAEAEAALSELRQKHPDQPDLDLLLDLIGQRYTHALRYTPKPADRWVRHPFPTMTEPERSILCLTDNGERLQDQLRYGFARASLRSLDRYFMQVRRKIHLLERPISSSSAAYRRYYGYSPYSAVVASRVLEIFRVVYNYHLVGQKKTTPAQRLGLINRACSLDDLLNGDARA